MRLTVVAALGTAALAAAAGVTVGWRYAPGSSDTDTNTRTHLVLATVPTGPPTYVLPQCAATRQPTFRSSDSPAPEQQSAGSVPAGFAPVRAVKCEQDFASSGITVTQSETRTDADLRTVLAALQTPRIEEPVGRYIACPAIGVVPVAIALVDAHGTAVRVDLPRDECSLYVGSALQTLHSAQWTVTSTTQAPLP